ncbi:MAG: 30S ribosomal protein S21 [Thermoguttaceae bacterium]|nr:30S ribosomal protein S21 [Thermoguttaceae bacterium]
MTVERLTGKIGKTGVLSLRRSRRRFVFAGDVRRRFARSASRRRFV